MRQGPCFIRAEDQYRGRTLQDLLDQQASTPGSEIVKDGLTVRKAQYFQDSSDILLRRSSASFMPLPANPSALI